MLSVIRNVVSLCALDIYQQEGMFMGESGAELLGQAEGYCLAQGKVDSLSLDLNVQLDTFGQIYDSSALYQSLEPHWCPLTGIKNTRCDWRPCPVKSKGYINSDKISFFFDVIMKY